MKPTTEVEAAQPVIVDYAVDENGDLVLVVDGRRVENVTAISVHREVDEPARITASFVLSRK